MIFPISASQVARIKGLQHQHLAVTCFLGESSYHIAQAGLTLTLKLMLILNS
jgi:hypothetical protein